MKIEPETSSPDSPGNYEKMRSQLAGAALGQTEANQQAVARLANLSTC